jgi:hypothetical protein
MLHFKWLLKSQNNRYWRTENPYAVHEVPFHDIKVGVWCAVSTQGIIGAMFFMKRYILNITED